jgi:hypothetical protein
MSTLEDLTEASDKLRALDERRKQQQTYRDHLIREAINEGIGWVAIRRATGMLDRSLQLAVRRTEGAKPS